MTPVPNSRAPLPAWLARAVLACIATGLPLGVALGLVSRYLF